MTRRRWIADEWTDISAVLLNGQADHLARVLRAQPGQQFDIVTGQNVRRGVILSIAKNRVEFSLHEAIEAASSLPLVIGLSIVRFERMEWAIEKMTELGVAQIIPLIAQRSEKHLAQAAAKRGERWRKIARESSQQSRRSDVPEILDAMRLSEYLTAAGEAPECLRLLLSESERRRTLQDCMRETFPANASAASQHSTQIHAAVGPEGGWTEAETRLFAEHSWKAVGLGPRILRAETAAIAIASVVGSWLA